MSSIITPLSVLHNIESKVSVELRIGQDGLEQQDGLGQSQVGGVLLEPQLQTDQEEMRQEAQSHVMMPACPTASLIVVQTNFLFGFLEAGLDRPAGYPLGV